MANRKLTKKDIILLAAAALSVLLLVAMIFVVDLLKVDHRAELVVEAGGDLPAAADFILDGEDGEKASATYAQPITVDMKTPGEYTVTVSCRSGGFMARLLVVDTVAPTATAQPLTWFGKETAPEAADFVTDLQDATAVTVTYETAPDLTATGEQMVTLLLTDAGGNTTKLQTVLHLVIDEEAPVIVGVQDQEVYVGDTISYRSGVTVTDNYDQNLSLTVDSASVDLSTPGVYRVTYSAKDTAGNETVVTASVTVYEKKPNFVEPDTIYAQVDSILSKILTDDMTERQKVERIYCWVHMHMLYSYSYHNPNQGDWLQGAYDMLLNRRGDCYSFFAINKLLLRRAGIATIDVEKVKNHDADSMHYWLLVSIDGGESYYHLDNVWSPELCLLTDGELDAYSQIHRNCFNRDTSLYPATPKDPLPDSVMPWNDNILRTTFN